MQFPKTLCLTIEGQSRSGKMFHWSLNSGSHLSIRGSNGSGKTTLLKAIAGLSAYDDALIPKRIWNDHPVHDPEPAYQTSLHYLGHRIGLNDQLSIFEEWQFWQNLDGGRALAKERLEAMHQKLHLEISGDHRIKYLSAGERQKVAIGRIMLCPRSIWILDEPDSHLDHASRAKLRGWYAEHLAAGGILLETSHDHHAAEHVWECG